MIRPKNRKQWLQAGAAHFSKEPLAWSKILKIPMEEINEKKILDYGCGNGGDAIVFMQSGGIVDVADILSENLFAVKKNAEALNYKINKFLFLEYSDKIHVENETYDIINANGVLHHIEYVIPIINEIWRVLKPDGVLYVMLYTEFLLEEHLDKICNWGGNWNNLFGTLTDGCEYTTFYTPEKVSRDFKGFQLLEYATYFNDFFRVYKLKKVIK